MVFGSFFLGFYSGFGGQELETTVKTKKNHQNSILRDDVKIVFFLFFLGFTVVLVVCCGFWCCSSFLQPRPL